MAPPVSRSAGIFPCLRRVDFDVKRVAIYIGILHVVIQDNKPADR